MKKREIESYRIRLLNLRKDLQEKLKKHRKKLSLLTNRNVGELVYSDHMAEMASLGAEREREVILMERTWRTLMEVEEALGRIEKGTFGVCVVCGKKIEKERLDLIPFAKTCAKCSEGFQTRR